MKRLLGASPPRTKIKGELLQNNFGGDNLRKSKNVFKHETTLPSVHVPHCYCEPFPGIRAELRYQQSRCANFRWFRFLRISRRARNTNDVQQSLSGGG